MPVRLGISYDPAGVSFAVYGFLLVMMMLLRPQGLLPDKRQDMK
jgi:branched-chain amino acid transport system permease protein